MCVYAYVLSLGRPNWRGNSLCAFYARHQFNWHDLDMPPLTKHGKYQQASLAQKELCDKCSKQCSPSHGESHFLEQNTTIYSKQKNTGETF